MGGVGFRVGAEVGVIVWLEKYYCCRWPGVGGVNVVRFMLLLLVLE